MAVTPEARSAEDTETIRLVDHLYQLVDVTPEARSAEDTETYNVFHRLSPFLWLHQRLDPRRILKLP